MEFQLYIASYKYLNKNYLIKLKFRNLKNFTIKNHNHLNKYLIKL